METSLPQRITSGEVEISRLEASAEDQSSFDDTVACYMDL